ncbi:Methyltransferase-like protein 5 [Borealophlyctis nickersoniae]|nr:Methyltransferase-like protein 5 [Borealophlyctis nickersoniae]
MDVDPDALAQASANCEEQDLVVDLLRTDVEMLCLEKEEEGGGEGEAAASGIVNRWPRLKADTVIMNPPFGTKTKKGIDMVFLRAAATVMSDFKYIHVNMLEVHIWTVDVYMEQIAEEAIYSLHKTSTREVGGAGTEHRPNPGVGEGKLLRNSGYVISLILCDYWPSLTFEHQYDIPASYKFHKKKSVDVEVDFLRFEKIDDD